MASGCHSFKEGSSKGYFCLRSTTKQSETTLGNIKSGLEFATGQKKTLLVLKFDEDSLGI